MSAQNYYCVRHDRSVNRKTAYFLGAWSAGAIEFTGTAAERFFSHAHYLAAGEYAVLIMVATIVPVVKGLWPQRPGKGHKRNDPPSASRC